jgi:hypothetical protein
MYVVHMNTHHDTSSIILYPITTTDLWGCHPPPQCNTYPWYVACMSAVHPLMVSCLSMSQPWSTSNWAMSSCPAIAANINGVAPSCGEQASLWLRSWSSMVRILLMSPGIHKTHHSQSSSYQKNIFHFIVKYFTNRLLKSWIKKLDCIPNFIASMISGFFSSAAKRPK